MATVRFTSHLSAFFDGLAPLSVEGRTVREALEGVEAHHPGFLDFVCDEQGAVRPHVNLFLGGRGVRDRQRLTDPVGEGDEIWVIQALSGG